MPRSRSSTSPAGVYGRIESLRRRHAWLDHLMRAAARYTDKHGNHFAAAITYFSVLALVPLAMIVFAVAGYFLFGNEQLLAELRSGIANTVPPALAPLINSVIDTAIAQRNAVGIVGLLVALYAGLGWMTNLREALSEQWYQRKTLPPLVKRYAVDLLAMIGLGLALLLSFAITAVGTEVSGRLLAFLGLGVHGWSGALVFLIGVVLTVAANWLVFVWIIARLPREPVTPRSAGRAAVIGAVGLVALQQVMAVYLASVTTSPAWAVFGPLLGLLVFANIVSRWVLFVAAWAATMRENEVERHPVPAPVVVRPSVTIGRAPAPGTAAGLFAAGAMLGLLAGSRHRHR